MLVTVLLALNTLMLSYCGTDGTLGNVVFWWHMLVYVSICGDIYQYKVINNKVKIKIETLLNIQIHHLTKINRGWHFQIFIIDIIFDINFNKNTEKKITNFDKCFGKKSDEILITILMKLSINFDFQSWCKLFFSIKMHYLEKMSYIKNYLATINQTFLKTCHEKLENNISII